MLSLIFNMILPFFHESSVNNFTQDAIFFIKSEIFIKTFTIFVTFFMMER
jgi:hypothetical protein